MVTNGDNPPAGLFGLVPVGRYGVVPRSGTSRHQSTPGRMQAHERQHVKHTHNQHISKPGLSELFLVVMKCVFAITAIPEPSTVVAVLACANDPTVNFDAGAC
jgi:hypothetical protein